MPSGKQTSFQYGEVSPINYYRSNDAEYSNSLHSLYNMVVKRQGGVRKIPGTKISSINSHYANTPAGEISYQRYKIFPYTRKSGDFRPIGIFSIHIEDDAARDDVTLRINGTTIAAGTYKVGASDGLAGVKAIQIDDTIFIHGLKASSGGTHRYAMVYITDLDAASPTVNFVVSYPLPTVAAPNVSGGNLIPTGAVVSAARYLISLELQDGTEIPSQLLERMVNGVTTDGFPAGAVTANDLVVPGDGVLCGFAHDIVLLDAVAQVLKSVKIYRTAVAGNSIGKVEGMALVAKYNQSEWVKGLPVAASHTLRVGLNDAGASIASITPLVDYSMYVDTGGIFDIFEGSSCSALYQERHIIGFDTFTNTNIKPGNMAVTKVGAPFQISRPIISNNADGFQMSIPVSDGSPVRAMIAAERLIAFSDRGTYVIQGGENGILTPTTINPIKLSSEGSSKYVSPLLVGRNIVYLNASHTKLMSVVFGDGYQAAVVEIAKLADHLLRGENFIEMQTLPGADDVVLLLKQNGELLSIAVSEEGVAGLSRVNLEGAKVESMSPFGNLNDSILIMSVVRNGIRAFETIADDSEINAYRLQAWTNSSAQEGTRLLDPTEQGYPHMNDISDLVIDANNYPYYQYLNITTASDYNAGSELTIVSDDEIGAGFTAYNKIRCYYLDDDGNTRYMYLTLTDAGTFTTVWTYTAIADIDVPTYLQDVEGNGALDAEEILLRTSRWLPVTTRITQSTDTIGIYALYLLLKDGASVNPTVAPDGEVEVAVFADGKIFSSPLNPHMGTPLKIVKETGVDPYIDFPEPVAFATIGVPYESYMQTLPIEVGEGRTLTDDKKLIDKVGIALYETIGGFAGDSSAVLSQNGGGMAPIVTRNSADPGSPDTGYSGYTAPIINSKWTKDGMVKILQVDPVPMTVLSVYPKGIAGD